MKMLCLPFSHRKPSMQKHNNLFYTTPAFVAGILLLNLRPMVDKIFASQYLSDTDIVLMGTVNLIIWIPECLVLSISYAIQSLTARADEKSGMFRYLLAGLMLMMMALTPILITLFCFPAFFLKYIAVSSPTDVHSLTFFRLRLVGCFLQCVIFCLRGFYAAYRNNRIFFTVIAVSLLVHVSAAHFMLSGPPWLPSLGIRSMGLSYCIAMAFGLGIYCEQWIKQLRRRLPSLPSYTSYYELLRISAPLTAHALIDHIGTTLIYTTTSQFYGALPLASLHLASSIIGVSPGAGFGLTALTEVSKASKKPSVSVLSVGNSILLFGSISLGLLGLVGSLYTPAILKLIAPYKLQLQNATIEPMQVLLASLCLHVACQIILKMLQAIDQTIMSVTINLSFVYGFRVPLLFLVGKMAGTSVFTVTMILACEKALKLLVMVAFWLVKARSYSMLPLAEKKPGMALS